MKLKISLTLNVLQVVYKCIKYYYCCMSMLLSFSIVVLFHCCPFLSAPCVLTWGGVSKGFYK